MSEVGGRELCAKLAVGKGPAIVTARMRSKANVLAQADGAGSFLALTGTGCGLVGNAVTIHTYALASVGRKNISENDSVALEINDSALTLQADTYNGTLTIVAQATP